jgi:hypothetical protein
MSDSYRQETHSISVMFLSCTFVNKHANGVDQPFERRQGRRQAIDLDSTRRGQSKVSGCTQNDERDTVRSTNVQEHGKHANGATLDMRYGEIFP